ncbi:hypothetical protein HYPBUDRAFT_142525 [Hyphopichia burtonii NRRL Y-1933]|uniref:Uncharacterized protein n=1 Tax=Hyphopichia burtonii NRRL Y-1933 TaxID=984485 RepID=A0A1E4RG36_9ASCO|nr:hypothetical protein HYPBUDRAFT_142525 [Hyphopichia burtonii NRRL Y-1933]ODV66181.1 hypothetical protein HYPBUDRAFT_142525 [Hyphopichia burtonii NRRL Y-1933]
METSRGILKKLGLFGVTAITFYVVGKKHIQKRNDEKHRLQTDARIDSEFDEFSTKVRRLGFPENKPNFNYEERPEDLKYVGKGDSYSTRKGGDRFTYTALFSRDDGEK